jgi:hypothetical protein
MLSRRIPLPPPSTSAPGVGPGAAAPAPALPPHLARTAAAGGVTSLNSSPALPSRPLSPQFSSRPGSPAFQALSLGRPSSPFRPGGTPRAGASPALHTPTSSIASTATAAAAPGSAPHPPLQPAELDVDLTASCPARVHVEQPFTVSFAATLSAPAAALSPGRTRALTLVAQHVHLPPPSAAALAAASALPSSAPTAGKPLPAEPFTPRLPSGYTTPTAAAPAPARAFDAVLADRLLAASPRQALFPLSPAPADADGGMRGARLPPPVPAPGEEAKYARTRGVVHLGASAVALPPVRLVAPAAAAASADAASPPVPPSDARAVSAEARFELEYLPLRKGFNALGGVRLLLVADWEEREGEEEGQRAKAARDRERWEATKVLREWEVVGEVWVEG